MSAEAASRAGAPALASLGVTVPVQDRLPAPVLVELALEAERLGYGLIAAGEVAGLDVFGLLAAVASRSTTATIETGVVPVYTRSVALLAMGFATLASFAPGRVVAGLGASSPTVVESWHGRRHVEPLRSVRTVVRELRRALAGERLDVEEGIVASHNWRLDLEPPPPVPIMLAAMNPNMLRLAGEIADAVELTWCPPAEAPRRVALVREGAERAGRDPGEVEISCSYFAYAGDDEKAALERLRRFVLQYATVPTHRAALSGAFPDLAPVEDAWRRGDRAEALRLVPDEAVHALCAIGSGEDVLRRAEELRSGGIVRPIVLPVGARPGDADGPFATVRAVAGAARRLGSPAR